MELVKARPWAAVHRVPLRDGAAFFKACRPVQAFEPALTAALGRRWPDRAPEVLAVDEERAWLLTADAGAPLVELGNPPERWLEILPRYAELQRGEAARAAEHLARGVPNVRPDALVAGFEALLERDVPLDGADRARGRDRLPALAALAGELAAGPVPATVEHADLHNRSVFAAGDALRILDWGDASIGHPFVSLVVTFDNLREDHGLDGRDPSLARLRDAYLEPWGGGLQALFEVAMRVGRVSRALGWLRHHEAMGPGAFAGFDRELPIVLRTAIDALRTTLSP